MAKKYFIRDGNTVRRCDFNFARMSWLEIIRYGIGITDLLYEAKELISDLLENALILILLPIKFPYNIYYARKRAREGCSRQYKFDCWKKEYWDYTSEELDKMAEEIEND